MLRMSGCVICPTFCASVMLSTMALICASCAVSFAIALVTVGQSARGVVGAMSSSPPQAVRPTPSASTPAPKRQAPGFIFTVNSSVE